MSPLLITLVTLIIQLSQAQPSIRSVCLQEPDTGSCRAYLPSFYFNAQTGSCDCFVYGGCAPGGNNFESMETCMMTCGKTQATQVMSRDCRMILSNVNVARPIGPTQNGGPGSSSQSSGPSLGGSSVSNQRPDFNESTVQQLQTIFNEISASSRPSSAQEAILPPQGQNQRPPNQQRVPPPNNQQVPAPSNQQRVPTPGTTVTRPVFPPPLPVPRPPPRQTPQSEKDFVLSKTKGDRQRPATSPIANQALQRQIEQQKELERQLQQTIQEHQQLQQQQQRQQQAQLLQQQLQQRQQHQQQLKKQQGAPV